MILRQCLFLLTLSFLPTTAFAAKTSDLSCSVMPQIIRTYFNQHYQVKEPGPEVVKAAAEQYYKSLDFNKSLFLKQEAQQLKIQLEKAFDQILKNNCAALNEIHTKTIARTKEVETFVREFIGSPKYKFSDNVSLVTDPEKRDFPKTIQERNDLLVKFLQFQMSNYLDSDTPQEEAKKKLIHRYELATKRLQERDQADLLSSYLNSFSSALDPHSSYFSTDDLEDFQITLGLSLEGIGVSLSSRDGYTTVEEIIPGGAAEKVKSLKPKDKIIAVSQDAKEFADIIDMDLRDVVRLIRGKKGTKVTLTVLRQGTKSERFQTTIVRDKIDLQKQAAQLEIQDITQDGKKLKIGIIKLPSFYGDDAENRTSYKDVKKLLAEAKTKKVDGLVLDLSRNGGGLLKDAVQISGLFVRSGGMVATQDSNGSTNVLKDSDPDIQFNAPLVVLTSRISASASEIVAGAIKDYRRGLIVGDDHTFGKGTVQSVLPLTQGLGALKITTGMFFRPSGESTQHSGVISDIVIPSRFAKEDIGEKSLPQSLKGRKITQFTSDVANFPPTEFKKFDPVNDSLVQEIKLRSQKRVEASEDFKKIKEELKKDQESSGAILLAELRKKAEEQKKDKKTDSKKKPGAPVKGAKDPTETAEENPEEEDNAPQLKESIQILADMIVLQTSKSTASR